MVCVDWSMYQFQNYYLGLCFPKKEQIGYGCVVKLCYAPLEHIEKLN
jgi:hypothetical protein